MSGQTIVYQAEFHAPGGQVYRPDTPSPASAGPWIADMFQLFPWHPSWAQQPVRVTTAIVHA
jgi:hypothetical protein